MNKAYLNSLSAESGGNGGRVVLLFLLFLLGLYLFYTSGITGLAAISVLPILVIYLYFAFKIRMFTFWTIFFVNYFIMYANRMLSLSIPISLLTEMIEILCLGVAAIDARDLHMKKIANLMFYTLIIWNSYIFLQLFNDAFGFGIDAAAWYTGARLRGFFLIYAFLIVVIYVNSPQKVKSFLSVWAILTIISAAYTWKQKTFGFNDAEAHWMATVGYTTHMVNGITRYPSFFNDAANFGSQMAAVSDLFLIVGVTSKIWKERILFISASLLALWAMGASGTRSAVFCFIGGMLVYIFLSKNIKLGSAIGVLALFFVFFLAFTTIGNGNPMIRRMRSAFNKDDASAGARKANQATMAKYLKDAPWGIGLGTDNTNVPKNHQLYAITNTPPDSEYVYIWMHTGVVGISLFLILTVIQICGASFIILFRLHNKSLQGIASGLCCSFIAMQVAAYGNQILFQFPNLFLFYGGLSLIFILPQIEPEWEAYEAQLVEEQEAKRKLKLENKRARRV